jgi:spore maturation protein CgeB
MKLVCFTHSLASCWNHGNAHFLRGVLRELVHAGHTVEAFEPGDGWSLRNLLEDAGPEGLAAWRSAYPELQTTAYGPDLDPAAAVEDADVVLVHEWNDPALVAALGRLRARGARFVLLFHDTHHRAVSAPREMERYDLDGYDGVLAFGSALADVYRRAGWSRRVFVWHEAADIRLFRPPPVEEERRGLVWIGNWGDGERGAELERFLLAPARAAALALDVFGVRYPGEAQDTLARYGARWRGWLANARVPSVFARYKATVHVPRRFYVDSLPGIPTIRVFEALACGIPLVCAPWRDDEGLFAPGRDFLTGQNRAGMTAALRAVTADPALAAALSGHGLATILARHTCRHRMGELLAIVDSIAAAPARAMETAP